jgi:hypothetical protein
MTKERARTDTIKGLHHKMPVGKHKTNTMQGKITDNETTTIATKLLGNFLNKTPTTKGIVESPTFDEIRYEHMFISGPHQQADLKG